MIPPRLKLLKIMLNRTAMGGRRCAVRFPLRRWLLPLRGLGTCIVFPGKGSEYDSDQLIV